jgi:hypothetical protein
MDVFNPRNDLLEEATPIWLLQSFTLYNIVKQLASIGILHDEE